MCSAHLECGEKSSVNKTHIYMICLFVCMVFFFTLGRHMETSPCDEIMQTKFYTYAWIIINKVGQLPFTVCDLQGVFLLCRQPKLSPLYEETPPGIHHFSAQFVLMECCCFFPLFPFFPCFTCELQDRWKFQRWSEDINIIQTCILKMRCFFFI